jgi:hypothetical protein
MRTGDIAGLSVGWRGYERASYFTQYVLPFCHSPVGFPVPSAPPTRPRPSMKFGTKISVSIGHFQVLGV